MMKTKTLSTVVTYWDAAGTSKKSATFKGHISPSEVERQMLFTRQCPKRRIIGHEHVTI